MIAVSQLFFSLVAKVSKKDGTINKWATKKKMSFRWAGFTNFTNEIYLTMAFGVCINSYAFGTSTPTITISTVISNVIALV